MASTLDHAAEQLARAASLLEGVSGNVQGAANWLALLGWDLPPGVADIGLARIDVSTVVIRLGELTALRGDESASDLEIAAAFGEVAIALGTALDQLATLADGFDATPDYLTATDIVDEFFPRLADLLVIQLVGAAAAPAIPIGILLGVFELTLLPADPAIFQVEHLRQKVRWDRISQLFSDPGALARDVYGWGTADFDADALIGNVARVLEAVAADSMVRPLPRRAEEELSGRPVPEADTDPATQLFVSLAKGPDQLDVGVTLYGLRSTVPGGTDGGLGVSPYASGTTDTSFPLAERLSLVLAAAADIQGGVALVLRAGADPDLKTGLIRPASGTPGRVGLALQLAAGEDSRQVLFDLPGLRLDAAGLTAGIGLGIGPMLDPTLTAGIQDGRLAVVPDRGDGFLATILPDGGVTAVVNLAISWSAVDGVRIAGGVGLQTSIGLHKTVGPLRFNTLNLALEPSAEAVSLAATITGAATLGPFEATVEGIGVAAELAFQRGNLGPVNLGFRFVPPSGLGLAIEAGPVSGGGFIRYDPAAGRYAGVLELDIGTIGVTGVGLLDTKLPGGADGFALLVAMRATFPPIQVGFGFALSSVGGLVALNRRVDVDALRQRLASGTAGRILAPEDPVRNAPTLLADLGAVFPPAPGITVVGPTVQLVWAGLVQFDIGVFIELPGPTRIILLGSALAVIEQPAGGRPYLRIRVDIVGVIDLQARTASFDAVLIDSSLLEVLELTGGAAFRLSWGDQPYAVFTVGGFNPAYNPEPLAFPSSLTRIAMVRGAPKDRLYLRFEGYFAVTTNTFQFGAAIEAIINVGNFNIQGILRFDALIQFQPFHFQFDIRASVRVRYKSRNLAGLTLTGSLSGPGPVIMRGKVCIELLFFDICFEETFRLGSDNPPAVTSVASAVAALLEELDRPDNLRASETVDRYVAVRPPPAGLAQPLVSPVGQLVWAQNRAPLGLLLERIGGAPLGAAETVEATSPDLAGPELDWFAPGSFADLSDGEALNRRAFERLAGGVRFGPPGTDDGPAATQTVTVRQIRLPAAATTAVVAESFPTWFTAAAQVRLGAPAGDPVTPHLSVREETWTVADPSEGMAIHGLSQAQAHQLAALGGTRVAFAPADRIADMPL